jgi:hypothetical protein
MSCFQRKSLSFIEKHLCSVIDGDFSPHLENIKFNPLVILSFLSESLK